MWGGEEGEGSKRPTRIRVGGGGGGIRNINWKGAATANICP